jgi:hypothetical protein
MISIKRIQMGSSIRFRGAEHTWIDTSFETFKNRVEVYWDKVNNFFFVVDKQSQAFVCVLPSNIRYFEVETPFSEMMNDGEDVLTKRGPGRPPKEIKAS